MTMLIATADEIDFATGTATRVVSAGLGNESLVGFVVIVSLLVLSFLLLWKFAFRELKDAVLEFAGIMRESMVCARDIAEIHERVIMRSPEDHREVLKERQRHPPDRSPSLRVAGRGGGGGGTPE